MGTASHASTKELCQPIVGAESELQNMGLKMMCPKVPAAETRASLFRTRSTTTPGDALFSWL